MVTISVSKTELFWICEALYEYGISATTHLIGQMAIKTLKKFKKHFTTRIDKTICEEWIQKVIKFHGFTTTTYKKVGKVK